MKDTDKINVNVVVAEADGSIASACEKTIFWPLGDLTIVSMPAGRVIEALRDNPTFVVVDGCEPEVAQKIRGAYKGIIIMAAEDVDHKKSLEKAGHGDYCCPRDNVAHFIGSLLEIHHLAK